MNEKTLELFVSLLLLGAGLVTLAFRNRRNRVIGFRVGYTLHSERVWWKVNTFVGLYLIACSLLLLALREALPLEVFIALTAVIVLSGTIAGTLLARREYELEELSTEAPEKPPATGKGTDVKPYVLLQLGLLGSYLLLAVLLWDKLPERMAIHFDVSGRPNLYVSRPFGVALPVLAWLVPFSLTLLAPIGFSRRTYALMTLLSAGLVFLADVVLLYNSALVPENAINYATLGFLVLVLYWLLKRGDVSSRGP